MKKSLKKIKVKKISWLFVGYLVLALGIRFWNYREAMYFIFDVGRDLIVLREMSQGDLKLIGQTTGLPGLFYGPLWYYVGVLGYVLTNGNPYGVQLWYIAITSLAIPMYWLLTHKLFGNNLWAKLTAMLLAFSPGGITGTNFVWNVMLSVPLMTGVTYCLIQARKSKKYLYVGFLLLALTLQAEFAYAVFFVTTLWFLIPWMRGKFEWKTMIIAALMVLITLIPQGLFEIMSGFSMTKSLIKSIGSSENSVTQTWLWQNRPEQLWEATKSFFIRSNQGEAMTVIGVVGLVIIAGLSVLAGEDYAWKLILIMSAIPYVYFMFWRGNYGHFFEYYITPHFIPLTILIVYGMKKLINLKSLGRSKVVGIMSVVVIILLLTINAYSHLYSIIIRPINNAGLRVMEQSIEELFSWAAVDHPSQVVFRIYTPNMTTENHDYLVWWYTKVHNIEHPITVQSEKDAIRYVLYEPDNYAEVRFVPWHNEVTAGFVRTRHEKIGILNLETWMKPAIVENKGMEEV